MPEVARTMLWERSTSRASHAAAASRFRLIAMMIIPFNLACRSSSAPLHALRPTQEGRTTDKRRSTLPPSRLLVHGSVLLRDRTRKAKKQSKQARPTSGHSRREDEGRSIARRAASKDNDNGIAFVGMRARSASEAVQATAEVPSPRS